MLGSSCRVCLTKHTPSWNRLTLPSIRWWRVFYWQQFRHHFEQCPIYLFWIPDCYSCTLCRVPHLWGELKMASLVELRVSGRESGLEMWRCWRETKLVKAPSGWQEWKYGVVCWQQDLTDLKLIAQWSAPRAAEATEIRAVYQVWEAPTAREMGGSVQRLHGTHGCFFQWCPFPLWIGLSPRCPPEEPKQGRETPYRTYNSLVTS